MSGTGTPGTLTPLPPGLAERFWAHVSPCPNTGHWWWDGYTQGRGKYPHLYVGKLMKASHVSLELHGYPRPSGEVFACHHCDTPLCVNPQHLYWGTRTSNAQDIYARDRAPKVWGGNVRRLAATHCKNGHEMTPETTYLRKEGWRQCRICVQDRKRDMRLRRKGSQS